MLEDINREKKDCKIKFMHPHGPAASFCWPVVDDICWIPFDKLINKIEAPENINRKNIQNKNSGYHEDNDTTKSADYEVIKVSFGFRKCLREYVYHPICVKLLPEIGIFYYFSQLDSS